jgi:hypothetical protein
MAQPSERSIPVDSNDRIRIRRELTERRERSRADFHQRLGGRQPQLFVLREPNLIGERLDGGRIAQLTQENDRPEQIPAVIGSQTTESIAERGNRRLAQRQHAFHLRDRHTDWPRRHFVDQFVQRGTRKISHATLSSSPSRPLRYRE